MIKNGRDAIAATSAARAAETAAAMSTVSATLNSGATVIMSFFRHNMY